MWMFALGGAVIVAAGAIVTFYVSPTSAPVRPSAPSSSLSATAKSSAPSLAAPTATTVPNPTGLVGEFAAFQKRARELQPREEIRDGIWRVRAQSGAVELEAGLNLRTHTLATRRVNGQSWQTEVLSVNGRDLAAETFGRLP